MIEWQLYWKSWWKRPIWARYTDYDPDYIRHCWIISIGPLQVRKIWYEAI